MPVMGFIFAPFSRPFMTGAGDLAVAGFPCVEICDFFCALSIGEILIACRASPVFQYTVCRAGGFNSVDFAQVLTMLGYIDRCLDAVMILNHGLAFGVREPLAAALIRARPIVDVAFCSAGGVLGLDVRQRMALDGGAVKSGNFICAQDPIEDFDLVDGADKAVTHRPALTAVCRRLIFTRICSIFILIPTSGGLTDLEVANLAQGICGDADLLHQLTIEIETQCIRCAVQLTDNMIS